MNNTGYQTTVVAYTKLDDYASRLYCVPCATLLSNDRLHKIDSKWIQHSRRFLAELLEEPGVCICSNCHLEIDK